MSDLYTSQVHLKRLLAGQATPAFTPAPEAVLKMLDPAFFPGMGALNEDEHGRLQCPVRGCGKWFPNLGAHLTSGHKGIPGARRLVIGALSLSPRVPLMSRDMRAKYVRRNPALRPNPAFHRGGTARRGRKYPMSIAERNFKDSCPAQLFAKIDSLAKKIGRSPVARDFRNEYGSGVLAAVIVYFGTWNAAKSAAGLSIGPSCNAWPADGPRAPTSAVRAAECLRAWYDAHGDLPTTLDVYDRVASPYLPTYQTLLRAFGVTSWHAAMRSAVENLQIKSERYGSPKSRAA